MRFDRRVGEPLPSSALRVHAPSGSHCQRGASRLLRRAVPMSWAGAVVGDVAGLGLWHQSLPPATTGGWRLLCPEDRPRQLASAAQGAGAHSPLWPTAAGTDRKRNPPRHRPAEAVAAPGAALEPGMAAARTLTGSQAQPGGHSPCPCIKAPYIPLSGGYAFVPGRRSVRRPRRMDRSVERHVNASLATFGLAEPTTLDAGAGTGRYRASAATRESGRKTSAPCPNSRAVIDEWPRAAPMPSTAA